ncbi:capsular polysaccharide biosynthesis protein [Thiorhodococcus minor]|uniref:Capsular polysaccharide biosynthesis protein n=2 Tax=Thiorhodococcus minor TaxID=57489 RepID=A0A6M0JXQ6_9GAMM|nr:capsular polysaccharide biosynthesis protein [Thiorhodococcus minor]NEV61127.1 capsular polysaccharide biosynthesis protein [Thiorhodococcus minor]
MIGILSRGILEIPHLEALLGEPVAATSTWRNPAAIRAVAGWGLKPTSARARRYALRHGLPYLALEDGFLRSVGLGNQDPPLSIVADHLGTYYDATQPSRLEHLISRPLTERERTRAEALRAAWRAARVSKYNHLPEKRDPLPESSILVVDQTLGDPAIGYGLASTACFEQMLRAALHENPESTVLVKIHPDVFAGRKKSHFDPRQLERLERVEVLAENVHPVSLLEQARKVYVVTSQLGFEALIWGKPVRTFGMPFYAGWGLTRDELPAPSRRGTASLAQLVHASLIDYPRYRDPETGEHCDVERVLAWLGLQRHMRERFGGPIRVLGFSPWKRKLAHRFMQGSELHFGERVMHSQAMHSNETVAVWGSTKTPPGVQALRLEDGFLRSVGLGADLVEPLSWVIDGRGLYYDARHPSDLEILLQNHEFPTSLLQRARRLRERIVATGLTKYNVGTTPWRRPECAARVILVTGQVETDASILCGAPAIRRNIELLRAAREENPDAYLIYKPHPDVLAGLRAKGDDETCAQEWCDEVVINVPMGPLLDAVDEVQVLTSLAGFEALLRGKAVVCHGIPFYAGWGLTAERAPIERRSRRLTLDMLVAGSLILYPTYISRTTQRFTTPERALDELLAWRKTERVPPWWHRLLLRPVLGWLADRRDARIG